MEISKVIKEVEETITIFEEQKDDLYFIESGGLLQLKSEKIKLEALKDKVERENPKPLTIDELKQRHEKPVWCVDGEGHKKWCIANAVNEDCIDNEAGAWVWHFYGMTGDGNQGLHSMGWLAYDYPPKEDK